MSRKCSTCDKEIQISCQATCSHWICGTCTLHDWRQDFERCECPICDKPIDLLIPTEANKSRHNPEILSKIHAYNHKFGPISDIPPSFLYHVLSRDLLMNNVSPTIYINARFFIVMIMILAYIYSPLREIFGTSVIFILWLFWYRYGASDYKLELCKRHGGDFRGV